jgi:REP element-mobilizing transposase RayT
MSRIARRVRQAGVYFITTDTWQRREVFRNPDPARMVVEQITECQERKFYRLHAFVLMPNHLHMLITPGEEASIEKAVMMIKVARPTESRRNYSTALRFGCLATMTVGFGISMSIESASNTSSRIL